MVYVNTNSPENANGYNNQINSTEKYPILESSLITIPIRSPLSPTPFSADGGVDDEIPKRDDRIPQWSNKETRDFIEIRAQLEWSFNIVKRNKHLWEMVVNRMREKGYRRTIDQCKCKWKNLVNKYKGIQLSEVDNAQQCPFFDELHAVFMPRENNEVQQVKLGPGTLSAKGKNERKLGSSESQSEEDLSGTQNDETEIESDPTPKRRNTRHQPRVKLVNSNNHNNNNKRIVALLEDMMRNFTEHQQWIDLQWKEMMEKREQERATMERAWKGAMEKLERERLAMDQSWREREVQHMLREESRAKTRDALLTTLVNKLIKDDNA